MDDAQAVICTWAGDDREIALQVIAEAAQQVPVIVVDMSPDAANIAEPSRQIPRTRVEHVPESSGLGESRQYGLRCASARYVAFLDSDASPRTGWFAALREAVQPDDVAVAGGPVLPMWPVDVHVPRLFRTAVAGDFLSMLDLGDERIDVPRVMPGNMIVDRRLTGDEVFDTSRGRRPGDLAGAEEIQMMIDVRERGLRLVYAPAAVVDHRTTADRMSWRWMWRRLHGAGREAAITGQALEPLPRRRRGADLAFLALAAVPFLLGRRKGRRMASGIISP